MAAWACVVCQTTYAKDQPEQICADCRRHRALGILIAPASDYIRGAGIAGLDVLDAIAELLGTATRLRRRHNRELMEEQRGAQRDASAAYHEGRVEGQRSQDQW